jgi:hypothetical protein
MKNDRAAFYCGFIADIIVAALRASLFLAKNVVLKWVYMKS